jgi:hypothetical protein
VVLGKPEYHRNIEFAMMMDIISAGDPMACWVTGLPPQL